MKTLYEGILADIEDTLTKGDDAVNTEMANERNSDLRKAFNIDDAIDVPFSYSNGTLSVFANQDSPKYKYMSLEASFDKDIRLSDCVKSINVLSCKGKFRISKVKDFTKQLCNNIIADSITVYDSCTSTVKGINFTARSSNGNIPYIYFNQRNPKFMNCSFEIDGSLNGNGKLVFKDIPEFNNVSSNSIKYMTIEKSVFTDSNIFNDSKWNNLFDFTRTVRCSKGTSYKENYNKPIIVKDIRAVRKMILSSDFYGCTYDDFPYRLKKDAKLSDFIDISKFKSLSQIFVADDKMCVLFINSEKNDIQKLISIYFVDMLKTTCNQNVLTEHDVANIIPLTSDGWYVLIIRR